MSFSLQAFSLLSVFAAAERRRRRHRFIRRRLPGLCRYCRLIFFRHFRFLRAAAAYHAFSVTGFSSAATFSPFYADTLCFRLIADIR